MKLSLQDIRFNSSQKKLEDWSLIEVIGKDRETFFQGQVTNDLSIISFGEAQLTARLNRTGKLQSYFYIAKLTEKLFILCPKILEEKIVTDFNKFIIMDDVELIKTTQDLYITFNPKLISPNDKKYLFQLNFCGLNAGLSFEKRENIPFVNNVELEELRILNGFPIWEKDIDENNFINDTFLNHLAISYSKGCFLGQETVAKIENNRGAAYYPVLLELKNTSQVSLGIFTIDGVKAGEVNYQIKNFLQVSLLRDFRVEGKTIELFTQDQVRLEGVVHYLPYYKNQNYQEIASELFHFGVEEFQSSHSEAALDCMKRAISFAPDYSDAYESVGVILGRKENYSEAIEWMNRLLIVKPSSVMAHTNKSLFLMKLGRIEEAEAEKALATVKSFSIFGEESKLKKKMEEEKKKKEDDINRREKMFFQVLDIDPDDTVALFGLGDVAFYRGQYLEAVSYLEKVVSLDEKYSAAYLLLGKSLEASGQSDLAQQVYKKGILIASKRGDMMPANEMQSRLNQIVVLSGLT